MSLFLSVDFKIFNQDDGRFSVHSRGNQCAFMSLTVASFSPKYSYNSGFTELQYSLRIRRKVV